MRLTQHMPLVRGAGIVVLLAFLVAGAAAVSITVPEGQVRRGDEISIVVQDLPDHATMSIRITGIFAVTPGGGFSFEARNFQMPFSLEDGQIQAGIQNTDTNRLLVEKGDTSVTKTGRSTAGSYSTSESYNISAGIYELMSLGGTAMPGASSVTGYLELTGRKIGPENGTISFVIEGFNLGTVEVTVTVDGTQVLSKTISVTAPPQATTVATTASGSDSSGGSSSYGGVSSGGGSSPGGTAITAATTAVTGTTAVQATSNTTPPRTAGNTTAATQTTKTGETTPVSSSPSEPPTLIIIIIVAAAAIVAAVFLYLRMREKQL
jgi:hypothetical protein